MFREKKEIPNYCVSDCMEDYIESGDYCEYKDESDNKSWLIASIILGIAAVGGFLAFIGYIIAVHAMKK